MPSSSAFAKYWATYREISRRYASKCISCCST